MSEKKAFWSSIPGVATGVVGFLSAIAGILGVSAQLGWIGGDDGGNGSVDAGGVTTTVAGGPIGSSATTLRGATGATSPTAAPGEFTVDPRSVAFEPLQAREAIVTVSNTGDVALTVRAPEVTGSGDEHFKAADVDCARSSLAPGRTCEMKVTFAPQRAGQYTAVLVVKASNAQRQVEVDLTGNAPLG
jgi:hypothetical protein